jgi:hypothetical protein
MTSVVATVEHSAATERLALLAEVSEHAWLRAGGTMPEYTRATMPIVVRTLNPRQAGG